MKWSEDDLKASKAVKSGLQRESWRREKMRIVTHSRLIAIFFRSPSERENAGKMRERLEESGSLYVQNRTVGIKCGRGARLLCCSASGDLSQPIKSRNVASKIRNSQLD